MAELSDVQSFASELSPWAHLATVFLAITPSRATILKQYGMGGIDRWTR